MAKKIVWLCTHYTNTNTHTGQAGGLAPSDPQWISAWWLGLLLVGLSLLVAAVPMMSFPARLPSPDPSSYCHKQRMEQQRMSDQEKGVLCPAAAAAAVVDSSPALRDFPAAVGRLLCNKLLLLRTASSVLHILPIAGLYTFLPKYLESQFQLTASKANMISGVAGILVMGFGIFASGVFMRTFKPKARLVAAWIAVTALLYAIGMLILMFVGCGQETRSFAGLPPPPTPTPLLMPASHQQHLHHQQQEQHATCGIQCSCPSGEFSPICTSEGITYLSPCIAGCSTATTVNLTVRERDLFRSSDQQTQN